MEKITPSPKHNESMQSHTQLPKSTRFIIWFSILAGLFILLEFAAGGIASLSGDFKVQSIPLMLVGLIPLIVSVIGRILILPKPTTNESFISTFIICLALCEGPAIAAMFVFPKEFITERAFTFISSVLGILVLCPIGIPNQTMSES